jgi:undecaprenyl-diphosphatase
MDQYWIAVVQGIVEGLTEFLPVSSTGHLILTGQLLNFTGDKADTFEIVIQLGAILAVLIVYWQRVLSLFGLAKDRPETRTTRVRGRKLNLIHIFLGIAPAMGLGFVLHGFIKSHLFSAYTVLWSLVFGAILMIVAEKVRRPVTATNLDELTYRQAFSIGLFQCLSLWPGFSRSGSTIAGGLLVGASHKASADFSFLMAIPIMVLASAYDMLKSYKSLSIDDIGFFAVGFVVAFVVAYLAVVYFLKLLEKVKLTPFAYYRLLLAAAFWFFVLR